MAQGNSLVSHRSWCRMAQTYCPRNGWLPSYHHGRTWSCCVILGGNQFLEGCWRALPCWPGRKLWWGRWRQSRGVSIALCTYPVVDGWRRSEWPGLTMLAHVFFFSFMTMFVRVLTCSPTMINHVNSCFCNPDSNLWPRLTIFKHDFFALVNYGLTCSFTMANHGWSLLLSEQFDHGWPWSALVPFNVHDWPWSNHGYITAKLWYIMVGNRVQPW